MRIAVNTRLLLPDKLEGIGWFVKETVNRLVRNNPDHEFHLIFDRPYRQDIIPDGAIAHVIPPPARRPLLFYIWFEYSLPYLFKRIKPDIFLTPDSFLSLRSTVPTVQVLHDLNFEHDQYGIPGLYYRYYKKYFPLFARKAARIATVSEYSKLDIQRTYDINSDKIDVVYSGLNHQYGVASAIAQVGVRERYSGGKPYFVYVGSLHGRKNVARLLQAFDIFCERHVHDIQLLIVGAPMFRHHELHAVFEGLKYKERVHFTGRVSNTELNGVLGSALGLIFVSLFEGFGLPILEAFQSGTPLITSNVTSMPEIAGDAALLVDPYSIDEIADAMYRIATDPVLRESLISKGFERKDLYTWDRTAELLWASITKTCQSL